MTNKEIMQADLLDILFEHRNKAYGAYSLRKNYSKRMGRSITITMGIALLLFFGFSAIAKKNLRDLPADVKNDDVVIRELEIEKPPEPPAPQEPPPPQEPVAQQQFTSQIRFVPEDVPTDVPEIDDLENKLISTVTIDGRLLDDPNELIKQSPIIAKGLGENDEQQKKDDFIKAEVPPRYPGGLQAFSDFLARYLHSPEDLEPGEKKIVVVRFKVDEDGTISDITVTQSAGNSYDREVIRVLKKMPKWEPALQNGRKVATFFTQPVTFVGMEG